MGQEQQNQSSQSKRIGPRHVAYNVTEREGAKAVWTSIGATFENRDGSYTLLLDALPPTLKFQLRAGKEAGEDELAGGGRMPTHELFSVQERGEGRDAYWLKVGVVFQNRDGSYTAKLELLPTTGRLQMRRPVRGEKRDSNPPF